MTYRRTRTLALIGLIGIAAACGEQDRRLWSKSGPDVLEPECPAAPTVDGRFTGWPGDSKCPEYVAAPAVGVYGDLYVRFQEGRVYVLNDWHLRDDAPIEPGWYNLFQLTTGNGAEHWVIRVYGDQTIEVERNGESIDVKHTAEGASGFHASPTNGTHHAIFEFSLPVMAGKATVSRHDPGPGGAASAEDALVEEPTMVTGILSAVGSSVRVTDEPVLWKLVPNVGLAKTPVQLRVANLPDGEPVVTFGATVVAVESVGEGTLLVHAPDIATDALVHVTVDGVVTNTLVFHHACSAPCGDKVCGTDACGNPCGSCDEGEICAEGACCTPGCQGRECGDDGCGSVCGGCPPAATCTLGQCVCEPSCSGKVCGGDGCGGSCGSCPAGEICANGACGCTPSCGPNSCGPDGCGGWCGGCPAGQTCEDGICACEPDCANKSCGGDGCGGSCGACPTGEICSKGKVCMAEW